MSGRILVVEDDERIRSSMRLALEGEGYEVKDAASGEEGLDLFAEAPTDVALIDLMLPGMDGFECCRALRRSSAVPIIIVTARSDTHDVVAGLEAGADDYVTKPFVAKELAARIRALLRRARPAEDEPGALMFGDLQLLPEQGVLRRLNGDEVHCTRTEFRLLCELAASPNKVLSREQLLDRVWGYDYFGDGRLVDVHIRRLRTKVEADPAVPQHILTVRGMGYKLVPYVKLGIGARITAVFGLGALLLSVLLGGISYFTVRHFLLEGRETAAQQTAFSNASLVRSTLESGDTQYVSLLAQIDAGTDAHSVLYHRSKAYVSSLSVNASSIPVSLRHEVQDGTAATQTYRNAAGTAEIAVGLPIPAVHAAYFEVFDLSDLDHTLSVLGVTLFVAGAVTTLLGIALGRFASQRLLRPLSDVSEAAGAIAGGELDTRLDIEAADPDLVGLTASFNAMVDQLQERIEREARFNSDVSHELRSPLTTLSAAVSVLETDRERLPARSQRALQLLSDDLRRFQRMVSDLLEMSRADAGSTDVFLEEVNVSELVRRSVEAGLGHMDGRRHGTPEVDVDPEVETWRVGVDKRRFERVLVNLMENADHYGGGVTTIAVGPGESSGSGPGGGSGAGATGGPRAPDRLVEVRVDDAGPGIDPAERTKVFERFYRGSASGRRGTGTGTGLGLALVAEHMAVMHGAVRVESSPDGGARFVLSLPVLSSGDEDDGEGDELDELVGEPGATP